MMNKAEWILTEDVFMRPSYRISPFTSGHISSNAKLPKDGSIDGFFADRYPQYQTYYVRKARHGITSVLKELTLQSNDLVTVLTTTNNLYISGCVTKAIEKVCKWNRLVTKETKAVLVVHEFGTVYQGINDIYQLGVPVIEDFAHSFYSLGCGAGKGDYLIFSFPKYFPIQYGGVILSKKRQIESDGIQPEQICYIKKVVSKYIVNIDEWRDKRVYNYNYLKKIFLQFNCHERFTFHDYETPSVFMFKVPQDIDLSILKIYFQNNGIESSVFYGEQVFFIPVHHGLEIEDLDYFAYVYRNFNKTKGQL